MRLGKVLIVTFVLMYPFLNYGQCTKGLSFSTGSNASLGITSTTGNARVDQIIKKSEAIFERLFKVNVDIKIMNGPNAFAVKSGHDYNDGTIYLGKHLMLSEFDLTKHKKEVDIRNKNSDNILGTMLNEISPEDGETVIMAIIAHEFGHIVQYKTNTVFPENHRQELHADYLAGGILSYYLKNERFRDQKTEFIDGVLVSPERLISGCGHAIMLSFSRKGDFYKWSPQHHGEPSQRLLSINAGIDAGMQRGCYISGSAIESLFQCGLYQIADDYYDNK